MCEPGCTKDHADRDGTYCHFYWWLPAINQGRVCTRTKQHCGPHVDRFHSTTHRG